LRRQTVGLHDNVADCFKLHNALMGAATNARLGVDMLCVALRDGRPTPYPPRAVILQKLEVIAEILNAVAPRSPLRVPYDESPTDPHHGGKIWEPK
jgi:hypothetical protein